MTAHDEPERCERAVASATESLEASRVAQLGRFGCFFLLLGACGSTGTADQASGGGTNASGREGVGARASTGGAAAGDAAGGKNDSGGKSGASAGRNDAGGGSGTGAGGSGGRINTGGGAAGKSGNAVSGGTAGKSGNAVSGGTAGKSGGTGGGGRAGLGSDADCLHDGDGKTTLAFVNHCATTLTFAGSDIRSGTVEPGKHQCVDIGSATETLSAKRYWGFLGSDPGAEHHSLAEFTFNTDFNDFDWYNISFVDAFNLPMQIVPAARPNCKTLTCAADFVDSCPDVGRYENASGQVVACVSPSRNDGNSPVARYFEACDDAYAWSGDDQNGTDPSPVRACAGEDWDIVFCPQGTP